MPSLAKWLPLIATLVFNAMANLLMKVGANANRTLPLDASLQERVLNYLNGATVLAIACFAVNVLFYRRALEQINLSIAYPIISSLGIVIITLASLLLPFIHERISPLQIGGIALIVCGVVMVTLQR